MQTKETVSLGRLGRAYQRRTKGVDFTEQMTERKKKMGREPEEAVPSQGTPDLEREERQREEGQGESIIDLP